jgi:uncharacterized protein YyaL (SSP411 family)
MNESFINIKVDREERPDLDRQYMMYVQATTGSGGWPLSVFLSPKSLVPIFGGTYFGPQDSASVGGRPSFKTILEIIAERWKSDPNTLEKTGEGLMKQIKRVADIVPTGSDHGGDVVRIKSIQKAFVHLSQIFDSQFGGFGSNTKFPMPGTVSMLLRYWSLWKDLDRATQFPSISELRQKFGTLSGDEASVRAMWQETLVNGMAMAEEAKKMVFTTLKHIARGGIHDHVAGGFHRYSVDRAWTLPHFEKMLYDQAQLIKLYSEAYLVFDRDPEFESLVKRAIEYVKERLLDVQGGAFYSAEDADSFDASLGKVEEGAFAVWSDKEINDILRNISGWSTDKIKTFKYHYTILPNGNLFNLTLDSYLKTKNVLIERHEASETADKLGKPILEVNNTLQSGLDILYSHRNKNRAFPHRDEKIITAWNGLMIEALSVAARVFEADCNGYLDMAFRCIEFIKTSLMYRDSDGNLKLWRSYFDGKSSEIPAFAEDYACLISGLIELNQTLQFSPRCKDEDFLKLATDLQSTLDVFYRDKAGGGYYDSLPSLHDGLIRIKDDNDGVEPSANSLSALNCMKLYSLTGKRVYLDNFKNIVKLFTKRLDKEPQAMTTLISAIILDSAKPSLLTLTKDPAMVLTELKRHFLPHLLVKLELDANSTTVGHICKGNVCSASETDSSKLLKQIFE